MGAGPNWTAEEKALIQENMHVPDKVLAEKLGRSAFAINAMKYRLRNHIVRKAPMMREFDVRPSGWYEEAVGVMLVECADAFSTWRHYHRYTEIEYTGFKDSLLGGIIFMKCRRDADAK